MAAYLQLSNIQGSCTDPHHPGWLHLEGFSFQGKSATTYQGKASFQPTMYITLLRSELGYAKLAAAALRGEDVGPGLMHIVDETSAQTLLAGGRMSKAASQITEYRMGKGIQVESQVPIRTSTSLPSAMSGAFLLLFPTVSKWMLPLSR